MKKKINKRMKRALMKIILQIKTIKCFSSTAIINIEEDTKICNIENKQNRYNDEAGLMF